MHSRIGQNTLLRLYVLREGRRLDEMARQREEPMWAALDFAATNGGDFTIRDMFNVWAKAGGGGDNAGYQQFSTAINNYIYKFDPRSPKAKYRNPRYKYIRVGKTDKGTVPAPLEYVSLGSRGAGQATRLRWREGVPPMRQPSMQKTPIHSEDDPVGDALDRLEKRLGRPALKASLERWKRLGDLHKITTDIMGDSQIRGKDKAYALQVAADHLLKAGKATKSQVARAEDQVDSQVGGGVESGGETGFEEDEPTQRDAQPLFGGDDEEMPDDLLHGGEDEGPSAGPQSDAPAEPQRDPDDEGDDEGDDGEAGSTEESSPPGARLPVLLHKDGQVVEATFTWSGGAWDEGRGTVVDQSGKRYAPRDGWEIQAQGNEVYDEKYSGMQLWLEQTWGKLVKNPTSEGGPDWTSSGGEGPPLGGSAGEDGQEDETMRGTLIDDEGNRIEVTIQYDEEEGALVTDGDRMYEPEDYSLEVANGVLSQEAFDALEDDGWSLVAADQGDGEEGGQEAQADSSSEESDGEPDGDDDGSGSEDDDGEEEPPAKGGAIEASDGGFPAYVPDPDEEGDRSERAMSILVDEGGLKGASPLWGQLHLAKDSADAHQVIMRSGLPKGLHKYALIVARAIFENTGRDFDTGKKNESRLLSLYGLQESPLEEPVDFNQESGLERLYSVKSKG